MIEEAPPVGVVYHVEFKDCCVAGEFASRLVEVRLDEDDVTLLRFENGVVLTEFLAVVLTPLGDRAG